MLRLLFFVWLLPLGAWAQAYDPARLYTPQQLQDDARTVYTALDQLHPGLGRYVPRDSVARAFADVLRTLDRPMTDVQFGLALRPLVGLTRCVHTSLTASKERTKHLERTKPPEFPLVLVYNGGRLYVGGVAKGYERVRRYDQIVSVNGQSATDLFRQFDPQSWADGYIEPGRHALTAARFGTWYDAFYGLRDTLTVQLADSVGALRSETLVLRSGAAKNAQQKAEADTARRSQRTLNTRPLYQKKDLTLTLTNGDSLAVLKLDGFRHGAMRRQFRRVFRLLRRRNVANLAIDVRGNPGGSATTCRELLRYVADRPFRLWDTAYALRRSVRDIPGPGLPGRVRYGGIFSWLELKLRLKQDSAGRWQQTYYRKTVSPSRWRFAGPLYVLTNGLSFSAAAIFPARAKALHPNATLIGRETGGGGVSCNAGHDFEITLPNTRYVLSIPYYHIRWNNPAPDRGRGVLPDVPVAISPADWRTSRDPDLAQVKALLRGATSAQKNTSSVSSQP